MEKSDKNENSDNTTFFNLKKVNIKTHLLHSNKALIRSLYVLFAHRVFLNSPRCDKYT